MEFVIKGRNFELSEDVRQRIEKKIKNNVSKFFDKVIKIEVELFIEKNPKITMDNIAEVTVFTPGEVIRTKGEGVDMFAAIDRVAGKLERQVKKYREKMIQKGRKNNNNSKAVTVKNIEDDVKNQIVKVKTFTIKPTTPEEAVMQMELVGHDFFVFINAETGKTAVVYKRKDKNYGLIEPNV
jgi:putative sigma-54 modulation protein